MNVSQMSYNVQTLLELKENGSLAANTIDHYLERVGKHMNPGELSITTATPSQMEFISRENSGDPEITYTMLTHLEDGKYYVTIDSMAVRVFESIPNYLQEGNIFNYFNESLADITITSPDDRYNIRGVRLETVFVETASGSEEVDGIQYPFTLWRFFKNVYINPPIL
jgi:hypothetical protein